MRTRDAPASDSRCDAASLALRLALSAWELDVADLFDLVQWPAMLVTVAAAWLVASRARGRREWGFWLFLASNALWIVWGWHDGAYALVVLQVALAFMNVRGIRRNDPEAPPAPEG